MMRYAALVALVAAGSGGAEMDMGPCPYVASVDDDDRTTHVGSRYADAIDTRRGVARVARR